ncbi:sugar MFS transporter [Termitidicoccus mucosus]|uniref:MFS transporter n=1 Tax=Termitidicoccus mucosus TaxID=1184151 RepID=A0A178IK13_9BACT|nr:MFS transporter [Opitutaceae bacterium TSB47]
MSKSIIRSASGKSFLIPFLLVSLLYLLWGCAHGLLDVLNKHFQGAFEMTKAESGFIQFSTYIAYFVMALPAGHIMRRLGYKKGIVTGLLIFTLGAFAFIPAAFVHSPLPFLVALFIIACGLCIIETGAHPYATSLGSEDGAAQRINIAAAFNGMGWIVGPLIGGMLIFGADANDNLALAKPYIAVGCAVLLVTVFFVFARMPELTPGSEGGSCSNAPPGPEGPIWAHRNLKLAIIAQFLYVGAQTGVFSFFINYVTELDPEISNLQASRLLGFGGMGLFLVGRLGSGFVMNRVPPARFLACFAGLAALCMVLVMLSAGRLSLYALYASFFFMSTMFPTIFALGVKGLGAHTKKASSYIVMGVAGGAIMPILMGWLGENNMAIGFSLPLAAFLFILYFGLSQGESRARR